MGKRIVIIGGVAAGAGAATKARRTDETAEIIIFEQGAYVSFANCGLPYYVGDVISEREELLLISPERFRERFNIEVKLHHEVVEINSQERFVVAQDLTKGREFKQQFDELVIATGGEPIKPPLQGIDLQNIFTLSTVPEAEAIKQFIEMAQPKTAVVVGGGFIGLEMVENLLQRGIKVSLVEKATQLLPPFDQDMALIVERNLAKQGVKIILADGLSSFMGSTKVEKVILESGNSLDADMVILSIGVKPRLSLAKRAGLAIGNSGGIVVDKRMQSSVPHIYAAGDIVETNHLVTGKKIRLPLAGPANKQARVAGSNAAGGCMEFPGVLGTAIVKACGLTAAKTGLSQKEAAEAGIDYYLSYTHSQHHAGYYPGAETMTIKLIVERNDGKLIGAQVVGPQGVDKRIDVLATAIYSKLTVEDLENLDLAYAPPFGSAKDPVIIAGFVAANVFRGEYEAITPEDFLQEVHSEIQLLDVRTPLEYKTGHIPHAVNIPLDELRARFTELDKARPVYTYCAVGYRSYQACKILRHHGYRAINLSGGYLHYQRMLPTE